MKKKIEFSFCISLTYSYLCRIIQLIIMKKRQKSIYLLSGIGCLLLFFAILAYFFLTPLSKSGQTEYLYVDNDDTVDSVFVKLSSIGNNHSISGMKTLIRHSSYADNIRSGRYAIDDDDCALTVFRRLKNGQQEPLNLTIPSVRTVDRLGAELGKKLMLDSATIVEALTDTATCQKYGYEPATIVCMFVPNTYELYWNVGLEKFLDRMKKESDAFWKGDRQAKADKMGLTPVEVITLASIVDEETANNAEKPMIAGMNLNRLRLKNGEYPNGVPLQADPTIKFAWQKFELKRIYNKLLSIDSPYNTYRRAGLPPGPIRIPTVAGIDAVLNYAHHNYLYMCAKEDFSGTHNFAATYSEHLQNAARYSKALNSRGIQ